MHDPQVKAYGVPGGLDMGGVNQCRCQGAGDVTGFSGASPVGKRTKGHAP